MLEIDKSDYRRKESPGYGLIKSVMSLIKITHEAGNLQHVIFFFHPTRGTFGFKRLYSTEKRKKNSSPKFLFYFSFTDEDTQTVKTFFFQDKIKQCANFRHIFLFTNSKRTEGHFLKTGKQ